MRKEYWALGIVTLSAVAAIALRIFLLWEQL
jgi:hypothetical protein